ncbi:hypothetical protein RDWZM_008948 [Blomia tropicalis]|uniref:BHLH domain-containing protein n=1 Tax=Blomia tropicalis TaxID=40697 RepID=A0A9Q0RKK8_BLOTA|nr:DNA-binding protein inhibitor ID-2 [Blomia tropicalis]KAJ6217791.1 hypothetical protein RDWZM_008948 [Blomia tropicalis]
MTKIRTPEPLDSCARLHHPTIIPTMMVQVGATQPIRVRKARRPLTPSEQRQRAADREEMQSLLSKLKQLVPGIPKRRKMSKLEIIQHVIDYIFDLQVALESHPINGSIAAAMIEFQPHLGLVHHRNSSRNDVHMFDHEFDRQHHHHRSEALAVSAMADSLESNLDHHSSNVSYQSATNIANTTTYSSSVPVTYACDLNYQTHGRISNRNSSQGERQPLASIML